MTPAQCRAARGLLNWTQAKLAEAAGIGVSIVTGFEQSWKVASPAKIQAMQRAFEAVGVEFIPENGSGAGVRMKKGKLN
jgi:transcriptional regulator with XRE-family HTH domain